MTGLLVQKQPDEDTVTSNVIGLGYKSTPRPRKWWSGPLVSDARAPDHEVMHLLRKGQMHGVGKAGITGQVAFIARLFGVAA